MFPISCYSIGAEDRITPRNPEAREENGMIFEKFGMRRGLCVAIILLTMAVAAGAHHSFAMYDHTRTLTLKGTVTKFQWTNPHAYLEIDVRDSKGAVKHYTLEGTSINMMQRIGWRSNMIKFGDAVKVVMAPATSGESVGLLLEVTLANGETKQLGVPAENTFKRTPEPEQKP